MLLPTVIAAIDIVNGLGQLFSGGPSMTDLLNLQTELLQNISQQLGVIQKGIETILDHLQEIEDLVGKLPESVVTLLFSKRVEALTQTYVEQMQGFKLEEEQHGLLQARAKFVPVIEDELLKPLRAARSDLFTLDEILLIPQVSQALHVEIHGMILADYQSPRILPALDRYRAWLERITASAGVFSIDSRMKQAREQRARLRASASQLSGHDLCLVSREVVPLPMFSSPGAGYSSQTRTSARLQYGSNAFVESRLAEVEVLAAPLLQSGAVTADDLPATLQPGPSSIREVKVSIVEVMQGSATPFLTQPTSSDPHAVAQNNDAVAQTIHHTRTCQGSPIAAAMIPQATELGTKVEQNGYSLLALGALGQAGREAMAAIDKFREQVIHAQ